jgi:hypothetical protein
MVNVGDQSLACDSQTANDSPDEAYFDPFEIIDATEFTVDADFLKRVDDHRKVGDVIAEAASRNGHGLFLRWSEKVRGPLDASYRLYLCLLRGCLPAINEALAHPTFARRGRRPSKKNPGLIALLLVAKPREEHERKACSTYAMTLDWAAMNQVAPADFADRLVGTTLKEIISIVRKRRAASRRFREAARDSAPGPAPTIKAVLETDIETPKITETETVKRISSTAQPASTPSTSTLEISVQSASGRRAIATFAVCASAANDLFAIVARCSQESHPGRLIAECLTALKAEVGNNPPKKSRDQHGGWRIRRTRPPQPPFRAKIIEKRRRKPSHRKGRHT